MNSTSILNKVINNLFKLGRSSFYDLSNLSKDELNLIFNDEVISIIKSDYEAYIKLLMNEDYPYFYNKKIVLDEMLYPALNPGAYYLLCLYCGNLNAYRNFPLLLDSIIKKFNICENESITLDSLVSKVFKYHDIKPDTSKVEIIPKLTGIYTDYSKYDNTYNINSVDVFNKEKFFVWSEHRTYDLENTVYKKWVSRFCGDGYGFDILSFDDISFQEKLIEVKSGLYDEFTLTKNEFRVMKESYLKNALYYIYKYTYDSINKIIIMHTIRYDHTKDLFIDELGEVYSYLMDEDGFYVYKKPKEKTL